MKKIILFTLFLLLALLPSNVFAEECTYTYKNTLVKKASNIIPSYTYIENNDTVTFDITLTNMNKDIYVVDQTTNKKYYFNGNQEITIQGYKPGTKVSFLIYTTDTACMGRSLATKYVNLPNYNKYYKDPLCVGKENYSVCYKWNEVNIDYEEFKKRVNSLYSEQTKNEETKEEIKTTIFDQIYNYLQQYYVFIIIGVSIIVIIIFIIKYRNYKKNDFGF